MSDFATVSDVQTLFRTLTPQEQTRAAALIPIVCDTLRARAELNGRNLDQMIIDSPHLASVAKSVTVDVVGRMLNTSTNMEPTTQFAESALGYSVSGSYLVPGGGLFIKKDELKRLGITRQRVGVISLWDSSRE